MITAEDILNMNFYKKEKFTREVTRACATL